MLLNIWQKKLIQQNKYDDAELKESIELSKYDDAELKQSIELSKYDDQPLVDKIIDLETKLTNTFKNIKDAL